VLSLRSTVGHERPQHLHAARLIIRMAEIVGQVIEGHAAAPSVKLLRLDLNILESPYVICFWNGDRPSENDRAPRRPERAWYRSHVRKIRPKD
jgi:hypothetical protein